MRRMYRVVLLLLLVSIVVIGAGLLYLDSILGYYRPAFEALASEALGVEVQYQEAHLDLVPIPSLRLESIVIDSKSTPQFSVRAPALYLQFDLTSLFSRHPHFHRILIERPAVTLHTSSPQLDSAKNEEQSIALPAINNQAPPIDFSVQLKALRLREGTLRLVSSDSSEILNVSPLSIELDVNVNSVANEDGSSSLSFQVKQIQASSGLRVNVGKGEKPLEIDNLGIKLSAEKNLAGIKVTNLKARGELRRVVDTGKRSQMNPIPLSVEIPELAFNPVFGTGTLGLMHLTVGNSTISLNASQPVGLNSATFDIESKAFDLREVSSVLSNHGVFTMPPNTPNVAHIALRVELHDLLPVAAQGSVVLKNERLGKTQPLFKELAFENINYSRTPKQSTLSTAIALREFVLVTALEKYKVAEAQGPLSYSHSSSGIHKFSGNLSVKNFQYSDAGVTITKVDADLSKIKGEIQNDSSATVRVALNGQSINLVTSDYLLDTLGAVKGDVLISVPAKGGYSVSGPVTVSKAGMTVAERRLDQVSGTVDMLISGPTKRFTSQTLNATFGDKKIGVRALFELTPDNYHLHETILEAFGGTITGQFHLQRGEGSPFSTLIDVATVQNDQMIPLLFPNKEANLKGRVKKLHLDAKGSWKDLWNTLNGTGSFVLEDGVIRKARANNVLVNTLKKLPRAATTIVPIDRSDRGLKENDDQYALQETFTRLIKGDLTISGKVLATSNLEVQSPNSTVKLAGTYSIDSGFDMRGSVIFLEETFRTLGGPIEPLRDLFGTIGKIELPVRIAGDSSNPSISADPSRILRTTAPTRALGDAIDGVSGVVGAIGDVLPFRSRRGTPTPTPIP